MYDASLYLPVNQDEKLVTQYLFYIAKYIFQTTRENFLTFTNKHGARSKNYKIDEDVFTSFRANTVKRANDLEETTLKSCLISSRLPKWDWTLLKWPEREGNGSKNTLGQERENLKRTWI